MTSPEYCNACHSRVNPLGYALDSFDALGRYRPEEDGQPIDTSVEIVALGEDVDGTYEDGPALMNAIAHSDMAGECYAEKWFEFALGRARDEGTDQATFDGIFERFEADGRDLQELVLAIVESPAFLRRFSSCPAGGSSSTRGRRCCGRKPHACRSTPRRRSSPGGCRRCCSCHPRRRRHGGSRIGGRSAGLADAAAGPLARLARGVVRRVAAGARGGASDLADVAGLDHAHRLVTGNPPASACRRRRPPNTW